MLSQRLLSISIHAGVAFGVLIFATWAAWKCIARKSRSLTRSYVADKVVVVNTPKEWDDIYEQLMKDLTKIKVLGMDCEWVQKHRVALLQLASPSGLCVLVRMFKLWPNFPPSLLQLMADKSILKVGVAVVDDAKRLHYDYEMSVYGCVDLRHVLKRVRGVFHCPSKGLRGLTNGVLRVDISKDLSVRCGNWEAENYTREQLDYAATDAAVAVDIFLQLVYTQIQISLKSVSNASLVSKGHNPEHLKFYMDNTFSEGSLSTKQTENCDESSLLDSHGERFHTDQEEKAEHFVTKMCSSKKSKPKSDFKIFHYSCLHEEKQNEFWKRACSLCQGIIDIGYNFQGKGVNLSAPNKRIDKIKKTNAYSTRKRPLWDNCRLEAPDGIVLCTCDMRKALWYIDKGLGSKVCDDPLTVRLNFEPTGRPELERNYYLQEKENICVVCGHDKYYVRKFIIPSEYRKFFPNALKDHSSHDVLLLCTPCHKRSCDFDSVLRLQLAEECNAPVESGATSKTVLNPELQKVRGAGRALKLSNQSIPEARIVELKNVLKNFYGVDHLTEDLIEQASAMDAKQTAENFVPHCKRVVLHMRQNSGLVAFQARWRQHFLDTMNPQFLPPFWSVDFVPDAWNQLACMKNE